MSRGLVLALLFLVTLRADASQSLGVLHIKVVVVDSERHAMPVPRHALLISANPASAPPRRIVTSLDGAVDVRLAPGNYTVESDRPVAFEGKAYQWTQMVDIVAGRDAVLELTADNAEVEVLTSATTSAVAPLSADPASLLARWQEGVVAIWTPTTHASGAVIDANGLIVTSQRAIGNATAIEVQLSPSVKVAASLLVADPVRDVVVLRIDPATAASVRPVLLGCAQAPPAIVEGQEIFAIEAPLRREKGTISGTVSRVTANAIESDLMPASGGSGGPAFTEGGTVVGIVSVGDESDGAKRGNSPIVRIGGVCGVVALAETKMNDAALPKATRLPVEPVHTRPADAPKEAALPRAGRRNPYQMSSSDFDIAFITPLQIDASEDRPELTRPLFDFRNWSEYVAERPQVLLVRATPKLVEGFWTKVARGAASTQGVALPAFKHPKSGFSRMRAFCGETEVTPIHPFKLEQRLSATETIYEGFYVFDPGALVPECVSVKLQLYSEKEPQKGDTIIVDAKVIQQIWQDFVGRVYHP